MPPIKFLTKSDFKWRCGFEEFQDGHHSSYLEYQNETILAILNLHVALMPSTKLWLNLTFYLGADIVEEFQNVGHLGYWNETILAILILHVAPMPLTKFQLNPT